MNSNLNKNLSQDFLQFLGSKSPLAGTEFFHIADMKITKEKLNEFALLELFASHPSFKELEKKIQYNFKSISWPFEAMTHRSFKNEFKIFKILDNERLEFLGDSLLATIISNELFNKYPDVGEGILSKFRSALVNGNHLAKLGRYLDLGSTLLIGKGELKNKNVSCNDNDKMLAQVVEALIASIYMDLGCDYNALKDIVLTFLLEGEKHGAYLLFNEELLKEFDEISRLQEMIMAYGLMPEYKLINSGVNGNPPFEMSLLICGKEIARVKENSKKIAHKRLATIALEKKKSFLHLNLNKKLKRS
ncbi:MAG: hypothetical protein HQK51_13350 [Oligoflexia bacterium]|nr:hypothetical protein [Oligoflexia bacterium]